jgi:hypothetical protein
MEGHKLLVKELGNCAACPDLAAAAQQAVQATQLVGLPPNQRKRSHIILAAAQAAQNLGLTE